jgi:glutamyl-tRNA(Gln) amidotransferase subunit D
MLNDKEIEGIIITHGSDTLHYTSAVLSFFLRNLNKPVVLTFSQRSIDRASSDAKMNLTCSVEMALSNCAEVMIVGHATTNDDFCFALPGTKTRKMHTSRRDTFKSINDKPIAKISPDGKIEFLKTYKPRNKDKVELDTKFTEKVALIKFYPSQSSNILDHYKKEGYKAVVLEMTGLGHVNASWIPKIKSLTKQGFIICATPQTIFGRLNPKVYSVGRELEKAGAIYLKDMLTETAYIKLSWVLGHKTWKTQEKVKEKMLENIEGELSEMLVE